MRNAITSLVLTLMLPASTLAQADSTVSARQIVAVLRGSVTPEFEMPSGPKVVMQSIGELKDRVAKLSRAGTRLIFLVGVRETSGEPLLFAEGRFAEFEAFCREYQINLSVDDLRNHYMLEGPEMNPFSIPVNCFAPLVSGRHLFRSSRSVN
jgi:hypothetical protein